MRITKIAAIAATAAMVVAITGCSRDGGSDQGEVTIVNSLPAATNTVDLVNWGLGDGEPLSIDPFGGGNPVVGNLCENLLSLQPDFTIEPGIATSAEWVDDSTFVIDLRDDVQFWDGTLVTPADVIYSFQRNLDPASPWFPQFVNVASMEETGPNQVTLTFSAPDSSFRDAISGMSGAVLSKAYGEKVGADLGTAAAGVMCTGPFKFESWTPGQEIVTVANENYWNGTPMTKKLVFKFISDGTTLTNALLAGEVDGAFTVPASSTSAFQKSDAGTFTLGSSTASYSIGPIGSTEYATNENVRQAFSYAIDRQKYIDAVLKGIAYPQKTFNAPFAFQGKEAAAVYQAGYDALPEIEYNMDKAKQLIADSGVDLSKPLTIALPAGAKEYSQGAAIFQEAAEALGITVKIDERQFPDYIALFYDPAAREGVDYFVAQGWLDTPGVLQYAQQFTLPLEQGGYYNTTGYSNPEVTELIQKARATLNVEQSANDFVAAQEIFAPAQLQITLAGTYWTSFLKKGLTGITTSIATVNSPWALHLGAE
jgi:peptide/nickel transport system substrate-binding protein